MISANSVILIVGLVCIVGHAAMLVWSILQPKRRLWPLAQVTLSSQFWIWSSTLAIFGSALLLGLLNWNSAGLDQTLRWGLGLPLIIFGNLIVWRGVFKIGVHATSGGVASLETTGLYRYSRNPQYMADVLILFGWSLLSASQWVLPVTLGGAAVLLLAPFAEEPWLLETYGPAYDRYTQTTGRYFGFSKDPY